MLVPSIAKTEMQRPQLTRRQVRNLRHAKPLTGIVAELPVEGQHPTPAKDNIASLCSLQSRTDSHAEACARSTIGGYVAHPALKPEIEQQPAKGIRGCGVLPDVEGVTAGSFGLCLLTPDGWLRGSADDDALSLGGITANIACELGKDVPVTTSYGTTTVHTLEEQVLAVRNPRPNRGPCNAFRGGFRVLSFGQP